MTDDLLRDDRKVREAFRSGERWALNEVYKVYFPVANIVVSQGFGGFRGFFNPADRDDAIQNIFVTAFDEKARLRYNGIDAYKKYLRGIAQNVCRRMLEKSTRFKRTDWEVPGGQQRETAEEALINAEAQQVMVRFREGLTDPFEQDLLQRYFVNGEAEETIAKDVGKTRYRVRKIITSLHKRMQRHVKHHGIA